MVSYKDILSLEAKVEDLEKKLRSLEREESNYETELSGAKTRSNVGLSTMPLNMTVGLTVKMLADTDVSRIKSNLSEVKGNITATKSHIKSLEREVELLKQKWKEERKEAELVVEKDSIYIKGDKDKRDLLFNAKMIKIYPAYRIYIYRIKISSKNKEKVHENWYKWFWKNRSFRFPRCYGAHRC